MTNQIIKIELTQKQLNSLVLILYGTIVINKNDSFLNTLLNDILNKLQNGQIC